jgi:hypothetical protein
MDDDHRRHEVVDGGISQMLERLWVLHWHTQAGFADLAAEAGAFGWWQPLLPTARTRRSALQSSASYCDDRTRHDPNNIVSQLA